MRPDGKVGGVVSAFSPCQRSGFISQSGSSALVCASGMLVARTARTHDQHQEDQSAHQFLPKVTRAWAFSTPKPTLMARYASHQQTTAISISGTLI